MCEWKYKQDCTKTKSAQSDCKLVPLGFSLGSIGTFHKLVCIGYGYAMGTQGVLKKKKIQMACRASYY